jgi:hypothetical protein
MPPNSLAGAIPHAASTSPKAGHGAHPCGGVRCETAYSFELMWAVLRLGATPSDTNIHPVGTRETDELRHSGQKAPASQNFQAPPLRA